MITLSVNSKNTPIKRQRLDFNTQPYCLQETHYKYKTQGVLVKRIGKI